MLNVDKKSLVIVSVVLVVTVISIIPLVLSLAGGQGKAQGNSCMAQCMGFNADYFDTSNELTQFCQEECNVGTGQGSCLTSEDGCCVPYTSDPDCLVYPECRPNEDCLSGEFCDFPAGQCGISNLVGTCKTFLFYCVVIYNPVCGCDGVTYGNDCIRMQNQVQLDHSGEC